MPATTQPDAPPPDRAELIRLVRGMSRILRADVEGKTTVHGVPVRRQYAEQAEDALLRDAAVLKLGQPVSR